MSIELTHTQRQHSRSFFLCFESNIGTLSFSHSHILSLGHFVELRIYFLPPLSPISSTAKSTNIAAFALICYRLDLISPHSTCPPGSRFDSSLVTAVSLHIRLHTQLHPRALCAYPTTRAGLGCPSPATTCTCAQTHQALLSGFFFWIVAGPSLVFLILGLLYILEVAQEQCLLCYHGQLNLISLLT